MLHLVLHLIQKQKKNIKRSIGPKKLKKNIGIPLQLLEELIILILKNYLILAQITIL